MGSLSHRVLSILHRKKSSTKKSSELSVPASKSEPKINVSLQEIYSDASPTVDIIAIHGSPGDPITTFTHSGTSCFWLRDLLPSLYHEQSPSQEIRVLSFHYPSSTLSALGAQSIASELLRCVVEARLKNGAEREIVWIVHSFGGALSKGLLAGSLVTDGKVSEFEKERDKIVDATRGIMFFGVARNGEGWRNLFFATQSTPQPEGEKVSDEVLRLRREVEWLKDLDESFRVLCEKGGFERTWYVESGGVGSGAGSSCHGRVKEQAGDVVIGLNKTHGGLVRFEGVEDEDWKKIEVL